MDIHAYKLSLIEKLLRINDEQTLRNVDSAMGEVESYAIDSMSAGEKSSYEAGKKDLEEGRVISYEDADRALDQKYPEIAS
jgi:hypothetical protein